MSSQSHRILLTGANGYIASHILSQLLSPSSSLPHSVRAVVRSVVDAKRIVQRDTQSYFGILLDDNNRKPICRLHFNRSQKYLGIFDEEKNETRHAISSIDEIYEYADQLKKTVGYYD